MHAYSRSQEHRRPSESHRPRKHGRGASLDFTVTEQEHGQASPPCRPGRGGVRSRGRSRRVSCKSPAEHVVSGPPAWGTGPPEVEGTCVMWQAWCAGARHGTALPCPTGRGSVHPPESVQKSVESHRAERSHRSYQIAHRPALEDCCPCVRFSDFIDILPEFCPVSGK